MACCLITPRHNLTWANVELSLHVFCAIHLIAISQEVSTNLNRNMCSEITLLQLQPYVPGASELK